MSLSRRFHTLLMLMFTKNQEAPERAQTDTTSEYADTITQVDLAAADGACLGALDILRALDAKLRSNLPVEPGPYELPVAAVADLKAFLKSSLLVEEEQQSVQNSPVQ